MNKIIAIILILAPFIGYSQVDWENPKGAIKSEEIVIEKDKQIVLPSVSRRFTSITIDPLSLDTAVTTYMPKEIKVELPKIPVKLRPKTMKTEPLNKTYWGNFKVGYGSYVSPYFKADVASKRSDEYALALHFKHFSSKNGPVDGENSGLSNTDAFISGKVFLNSATLGARVGGKFDTYHLYGYGANPVPEAQDIRQRLSNYSIGLSLTDNDKNDDFFYTLNGGADFFQAKDLTWKETDLFADFNSSVNITNELHLNFLGSLHAANQDKDVFGIKNNRLFYSVKPIGVYTYDGFTFELGAGLYGTKDSINLYNHKMYITPHLVARYNFAAGHMVSGGLIGDVVWKSARNQFDKNPYLGATTVINNEVKPIDIFIEANGKLAPKVDYTFEYHTQVYNVYGQFINNTGDQSTFYLDYQTTNNLIHSFKGQLDFISSKNLLLSLHGKYNVFSFDLIQQPYHVPQVDVGLKANFRANEKIDLELAFTYLDGIYALDLNSLPNSEVKLNSILDLNISGNYKINSSFGAFIKMQNIIGNQYQYFYNYPTKGFQFLAGLSFTL